MEDKYSYFYNEKGDYTVAFKESTDEEEYIAICMDAEKADVVSKALNQFEDWTPVTIEPPIGEEYNVVWDLEDGEPPVTSTMEYDFINKKWVDTRGEKDTIQKVLFWKPLPKPPEKS